MNRDEMIKYLEESQDFAGECMILNELTLDDLVEVLGNFKTETLSVFVENVKEYINLVQ